MINFSDMFGADKDKKPDAEGKKESGAPIDFSSLDKKSFAQEPLAPQEEGENQELPQEIQPDINEVNPHEEVLEFYGKAVALADTLFRSDQGLDKAKVQDVAALVEVLVAHISKNTQTLLPSVFTYPHQDVNYLSLNAANVTILSLEIGVALEYEETDLIDLGIASFLHNVGIKRYFDLANQPRKLLPQEKKEIEHHPLIATEMLRLIKNGLDDLTVKIIEQHHERNDGSGYPKGLSDGEINEFAQLIGLADIFEALTHRRPYRGKYSALEAFKILVEDKETFNPKIVKAFIERIGIYPLGTSVELNTKEVAQVIRQNSRMPASPVVRVVYDPQGNKIDKVRYVDLSKGTKIYITKGV